MKRFFGFIVIVMMLVGLCMAQGCGDTTCSGGSASITGTTTVAPTNNQPVNSHNTTETEPVTPAPAG